MNENRVQVIERLKQANNVLVTVNNNPNVDELAACLGVTLLLNKIGKHATAVFSGKVPSTIEFLKPEETFEKNTDSLRDFIISLDKSKADKLRYKVEDTMVKIFITPYRSSISDKDLEFSQGDFNVDVVLALGIHDRDQVDQAIMAHGRILHDAIVMSLDNKAGEGLGTINWVEERASSLSEMITSIAEELKAQSLDSQISTALLTGIVSATERFRNDKTTSITMSMSSKLMAGGANQQLIATELEPPKEEPMQPDAELPQIESEEQAESVEPESPPQEEQPTEANDIETEQPESSDGEIKISHLDGLEVKEEETEQEVDPNEIHIDDEGQLRRAEDLAEEKAKKEKEAREKAEKEDSEKPRKDSRLVIQPPTLGGTLTANSRPEQLEPSTDPLSNKDEEQPLLERKTYIDDQTLDKIEEAVHQKEEGIAELPSQKNEYPTSYFDNQSAVPLQPADQPSEEAARGAIDNAINQAEASGMVPPTPQDSVGSTPVDLDLGHPDVVQPSPQPSPLSTGQPTYPPNLVPPVPPVGSEITASDVDKPESPPPVPPPMVPPSQPFNT
jgi:hypothetical protein